MIVLLAQPSTIFEDDTHDFRSHQGNRSSCASSQVVQKNQWRKRETSHVLDFGFDRSIIPVMSRKIVIRYPCQSKLAPSGFLTSGFRRSMRLKNHQYSLLPTACYQSDTWVKIMLSASVHCPDVHGALSKQNCNIQCV